MKASELIEQLQKIVAENGDVEISIYDRDAWPDYFVEITEIQKHDNNGNSIWMIE